MTTLTAIHRSDYGMACAQCGDALIAPEWSEYVSDRHVRHLWSCASCGSQFETSVFFTTVATLQTDLRDQFFPSLLVA